MRYPKLTLTVFLFIVLLFMFTNTPNSTTVDDQARAKLYCAGEGKNPPKKFSSDVCSRWPDGNWGSCCIEHDIKYWCDGTDDERLVADQEIRACINEIKPGMGTLMFWGIRTGGVSWLPTPYRWGYGWPWPVSED